MKANEAPEKIYRRLEGKYIKYYDYKPAKISYDEKEPTEYIRKDVFVEKACEWLKENITNNPNATKVIGRKGCVTMGMLIKDFKKAMEE